MSKPVTLTSPRYRVVLGDPDDEATWQEVEVQALTRDIQHAEQMFVQRRWGKPADQPVKITAVAAYCALLRKGLISGTWEEFEQSYLEVGEAGSDEIPPTEPGLIPG